MLIEELVSYGFRVFIWLFDMPLSVLGKCSIRGFWAIQALGLVLQAKANPWRNLMLRHAPIP